jgi:hypothetical protein
MLSYNITNIPNQTFSCDTPNGTYYFELMSFRGLMYVSISKDDVTLVNGVRIVQNKPIIPLGLARNGNFMFISNSEEYPTYKELDSSVKLVYITPEDLLDNE